MFYEVKKFMFNYIKYAGLASFALIMMPSVGQSQMYNDFNVKGGVLSKKGVGPSINQSNQRLEIIIPANSKNDPIEGVFNSVYTSSCFVKGDFDIQTDYYILAAQPSNGVRIGLNMEGSSIPISVQRTSFSSHDSETAGEYYGVNFGNTLILSQTTDKSGKLRLKKEGNTLTGYFYDKTTKNWTVIGSGTANTDNLSFGLAAWSHENFFDRKYTKVAFDNVYVHKGVYCQFMGN